MRRKTRFFIYVYDLRHPTTLKLMPHITFHKDHSPLIYEIIDIFTTRTKKIRNHRDNTKPNILRKKRLRPPITV